MGAVLRRPHRRALHQLDTRPRPLCAGDLALPAPTSVTLVAAEFVAEARVAAKQEVADGFVTLALRDLSDHPLPPWEPGAHVDLILDSTPTRQYSLCGDPTDRHEYRIGILRDPDGRGGSRYVHDRLRVGDVVRVRGPRNNFPFVESPRYLFLAGGIGITPILPMIRAAEAAGAEWRLVHGGRRRDSMAFLDELSHYGDRVEGASAERDRFASPCHGQPVMGGWVASQRR